jgi:hypothetical protein
VTAVPTAIPASAARRPATVRVQHALTRYYDDIGRIAQAVRAGRVPAAGFEPPFDLPPLTDPLRRYFAASDVEIGWLGRYRGVDLALLNLMCNPATKTTKTPASLLMVARAVAHIRRTGERIMILTPSSANKATALRDAVLRAVEYRLVSRDELRITVVVPAAARAKLWSSALATDPGLRARNPVLVYAGPERSAVKQLAQQAAESAAGALWRAARTRLWYSLDLDNYRMADALRAFVEQDAAAPDPGRSRLHAHAVSSAYGLLGHHLGSTLVAPGRRPRYFLVQHLDTPDMVLSLLYGSADHRLLPRYRHDSRTGLYRQSASPHFPAATENPGEVIDSTFYTRAPVTAPRMNELIRAGGGGGIVVSRHECLARYDEVGTLLAGAGVRLPAEPARLREWSLLMALTGVLTGIDRGLVTEDEVVVHGSGCYSLDDFDPVPAGAMQPAADAADVSRALLGAAMADN